MKPRLIEIVTVKVCIMKLCSFTRSYINKINIEYFCFRLFMVFVYILPFKLMIFIFRAMATVFYYILARYRAEALKNLSIAFEQKSKHERNHIAKEAFKNMVTTFIEFAYSSKYSDEKLESMIKIEGLDNLQNALKKGHGVVIITGHIGNWENIAFILGIQKYSPAFIVRSLGNYKIGRYVSRLRTCRGGQEIDRRKADYRKIFEALSENRVVGFLSDQNSMSGVFVYFFGQLASAAVGSIKVAMKTGSPIIFAFDKRGDDYSHTVTFSQEMPLDIKESKARTVLYNTQKYTKILESYIEENPTDWLWFHNRYKTSVEQKPNALRYDYFDKY